MAGDTGSLTKANSDRRFRIRNHSKIHLKSWVISLERNGFVPCAFKNCNFLAFDVENMSDHFTFCNGNSTGGMDVCRICNRATDSLAKLLAHIVYFHPLAATEDEKTQLAKLTSHRREAPKAVSKVLLNSWELFLNVKGYLKCLAPDCFFLFRDIAEMRTHYLTSCPVETSDKPVYVCPYCQGRTLEQDALDSHISHHSEDSQLKKPKIISRTIITQWCNRLKLYDVAKCATLGCQFVEGDLDKLMSHYVLCYTASPEQLNVCALCNAWLLDEVSQIKHEQNYHRKNDPPFYHHMTEYIFDPPSESLEDDPEYKILIFDDHAEEGLCNSQSDNISTSSSSSSPPFLSSFDEDQNMEYPGQDEEQKNEEMTPNNSERWSKTSSSMKHNEKSKRLSGNNVLKESPFLRTKKKSKTIAPEDEAPSTSESSEQFLYPWATSEMASSTFQSSEVPKTLLESMAKKYQGEQTDGPTVMVDITADNQKWSVGVPREVIESEKFDTSFAARQMSNDLDTLLTLVWPKTTIRNPNRMKCNFSKHSRLLHSDKMPLSVNKSSKHGIRVYKRDMYIPPVINFKEEMGKAPSPELTTHRANDINNPQSDPLADCPPANSRNSESDCSKVMSKNSLVPLDCSENSIATKEVCIFDENGDLSYDISEIEFPPTFSSKQIHQDVDPKNKISNREIISKGVVVNNVPSDDPPAADQNLKKIGDDCPYVLEMDDKNDNETLIDVSESNPNLTMQCDINVDHDVVYVFDPVRGKQERLSVVAQMPNYYVLKVSNDEHPASVKCEGEIPSGPSGKTGDVDETPDGVVPVAKQTADGSKTDTGSTVCLNRKRKRSSNSQDNPEESKECADVLSKHKALKLIEQDEFKGFDKMTATMTPKALFFETLMKTGKYHQTSLTSHTICDNEDEKLIIENSENNLPENIENCKYGELNSGDLKICEAQDTQKCAELNPNNELPETRGKAQESEIMKDNLKLKGVDASKTCQIDIQEGNLEIGGAGSPKNIADKREETICGTVGKSVDKETSIVALKEGEIVSPVETKENEVALNKLAPNVVTDSNCGEDRANNPNVKGVRRKRWSLDPSLETGVRRTERKSKPSFKKMMSNISKSRSRSLSNKTSKQDKHKTNGLKQINVRESNTNKCSDKLINTKNVQTSIDGTNQFQRKSNKQGAHSSNNKTDNLSKANRSDGKNRGSYSCVAPLPKRRGMMAEMFPDEYLIETKRAQPHKCYINKSRGNKVGFNAVGNIVQGGKLFGGTEGMRESHALASETVTSKQIIKTVSESDSTVVSRLEAEGGTTVAPSDLLVDPIQEVVSPVLTSEPDDISVKGRDKQTLQLDEPPKQIRQSASPVLQFADKVREKNSSLRETVSKSEFSLPSSETGTLSEECRGPDLNCDELSTDVHGTLESGVDMPLEGCKRDLDEPTTSVHKTIEFTKHTDGLISECGSPALALECETGTLDALKMHQSTSLCGASKLAKEIIEEISVSETDTGPVDEFKKEVRGKNCDTLSTNVCNPIKLSGQCVKHIRESDPEVLVLEADTFVAGDSEKVPNDKNFHVSPKNVCCSKTEKDAAMLVLEADASVVEGREKVANDENVDVSLTNVSCSKTEKNAAMLVLEADASVVEGREKVANDKHCDVSTNVCCSKTEEDATMLVLEADASVVEGREKVANDKHCDVSTNVCCSKTEEDATMLVLEADASVVEGREKVANDKNYDVSHTNVSCSKTEKDATMLVLEADTSVVEGYEKVANDKNYDVSHTNVSCSKTEKDATMLVLEADASVVEGREKVANNENVDVSLTNVSCSKTKKDAAMMVLEADASVVEGREKVSNDKNVGVSPTNVSCSKMEKDATMLVLEADTFVAGDSEKVANDKHCDVSTNVSCSKTDEDATMLVLEADASVVEGREKVANDENFDLSSATIVCDSVKLSEPFVESIPRTHPPTLVLDDDVEELEGCEKVLDVKNCDVPSKNVCDSIKSSKQFVKSEKDSPMLTSEADTLAAGNYEKVATDRNCDTPSTNVCNSIKSSESFVESISECPPPKPELVTDTEVLVGCEKVADNKNCDTSANVCDSIKSSGRIVEEKGASKLLKGGPASKESFEQVVTDEDCDTPSTNVRQSTKQSLESMSKIDSPALALETETVDCEKVASDNSCDPVTPSDPFIKHILKSDSPTLTLKADTVIVGGCEKPAGDSNCDGSSTDVGEPVKSSNPPSECISECASPALDSESESVEAEICDESIDVGNTNALSKDGSSDLKSTSSANKPLLDLKSETPPFRLFTEQVTEQDCAASSTDVCEITDLSRECISGCTSPVLDSESASVPAEVLGESIENVSGQSIGVSSSVKLASPVNEPTLESASPLSDLKAETPLAGLFGGHVTKQDCSASSTDVGENAKSSNNLEAKAVGKISDKSIDEKNVSVPSVGKCRGVKSSRLNKPTSKSAPSLSNLKTEVLPTEISGKTLTEGNDIASSVLLSDRHPPSPVGSGTVTPLGKRSKRGRKCDTSSRSSRRSLRENTKSISGSVESPTVTQAGESGDEDNEEQSRVDDSNASLLEDGMTPSSFSGDLSCSSLPGYNREDSYMGQDTSFTNTTLDSTITDTNLNDSSFGNVHVKKSRKRITSYADKGGNIVQDIEGRIDAAFKLEDPMKMVKCALCSEEMTAREYQKVHLKKHSFICWLEEEPPLPLENSEFMSLILLRGKRMFPKFVFKCEKCKASKKSANGFLIHLKTCGLSDQELADLKTSCPHCNKKLSKDKIEAHIANVHNKTEMDIVDSPNNKSKPLPKRSAATMCLNRMSQGDTSCYDKDDGQGDWIPSTSQLEHTCPECSFVSASSRGLKTHMVNDHSKAVDSFEDTTFLRLYKLAEGRKFWYSIQDCVKAVEEMRANNYSRQNLQFNFDTNGSVTRILCEDEYSQYIPLMEKSMKVSFMSDEWEEMNRFESSLVEGNQLIFCGGPVWAVAWCPTEGQQYLAVAAHASMSKEYSIGDLDCGPGIVQLWSLGEIINDKPVGDHTKPSFAYGLAHNYGAVWGLEWCPSGCNDDARLGLIAMATSCGSVPIYALPQPKLLANESGAKELIYTAEPGIVLEQRGSEKSQCTCLSWSKIKPHNLIACGFANGMVAVYDLELTTKLLRKDTKLYPYKVFYPHLSVVTAVELIPTSDHILVTSSLDKSTKIWDLRDTSVPHNVQRRGLVTCSTWLTNLSASVNSYDDAYTLYVSSVGLNGFKNFANQTQVLVPATDSNSSVWCVSANDWINSVAASFDGGHVVLIYGVQEEKKKIPKIIVQSKLQALECHEKPCSKKKGKKPTKENDRLKFNCSKYDEAVEKYGLLLQVDTLMTGNDKLVDDHDNPIQVFPLASANRVRWNPNNKSYYSLAVGYQSGFVLVTKLLSPPTSLYHARYHRRTK